MRVNVLFFGMLKDLVGRPEEQLELPEGASLGAVFEHYAGRFPRLREMQASIVLARNHEFCHAAQALAGGDEVALLPPVSGGTPRHLVALTRQPIDARKIAERLLTGEEGAVVTFEGVVRNNTNGRPTRCLDYECYKPMAVKMMERIAADIAAEYAVTRVALIHRLGRLLIGETSVAVVVTAPHRRPAFEAALEGINRLKRLVPIWKKEHFADGEVWVEGEWDQNVPVAGAR